MTSYSTRKKLTFTLTARPVTMTWTQSWAFSVICTYTIVQTWITVAWIHWNNKVLYTNSWCSKSNTIHIYTCITITLFLSCSIHYAHLVFDRKLSLLHFNAWPKRGPGFPMSYVMIFFVFNDLRWEIVHFVDICGVVDSLFIRVTRRVPLV